MSTFEFLMVLVSLIIGLGIAELMSGVARMIRSRKSVEPYWPHSLLVIITFVALLQQWWEIWDLRDIAVWTFPGLIMMLAAPIGLFLIAHLIFPEQRDQVDLREHYYDEMQPVFWIVVATVILSVTFRPVVLGSELLRLDNLSSFVIVAIFVALSVIKKSWFHGTMLVLVFIGILADILLAGYQVS